MPIRMTGMMSGLDTESIIQQLVEVRRTKVDTVKKDQTKLGWKQEAWKDLNKDIKKLYTGTLSNLRFESSFSKKTTEVSKPSACDVTTSDSAMLSNQKLKIKSLAQAGYLTGAKIKRADTTDTTKLTSASKATELGLNVGDEFTITTGGKTRTVAITEKTTLNDIANEISKSGVNCNFDATNQRFFVGSKETGEDSDFSFGGSASALAALGLTGEGSTKITGKNAEIELNGATFESSSNTFEINGLTIACKEETGDNAITLNTKSDTSGIYDMVKKFVKEYTELINKMDKLYNADAAKGYEPLTDDEKEAMSESEIEKWETTIKDSLLRHDSDLSNVASAFKQMMSKGYEVGGKMMYLTDFGIENQNYFNAADNEKNAYHIKGDEDDDVFSTEANKLKEMIEKDSSSVISFFTQLAKGLYEKVGDMSKAVAGYKSYGSVYNDLKMTSDYKSYDSKIDDMEEKLNDYEDKWYKKFSAMETALAKMQSNASAFGNMFGSNQ